MSEVFHGRRKPPSLRPVVGPPLSHVVVHELSFLVPVPLPRLPAVTRGAVFRRIPVVVASGAPNDQLVVANPRDENVLNDIVTCLCAGRKENNVKSPLIKTLLN